MIVIRFVRYIMNDCIGRLNSLNFAGEIECIVEVLATYYAYHILPGAQPSVGGFSGAGATVFCPALNGLFVELINGKTKFDPSPVSCLPLFFP